MFEQTFKNIDNVLRTEAGCQNELDYIEQTSWIIFLKYLDDLEADREAAAELAGKTYKPILAPSTGGGSGQFPRPRAGEIDHHKALTGDDLSEFVIRNCSRTSPSSRPTQNTPTPSNTRSVKSSGSYATRFTAATTCAKSSIAWTSCAFAPSGKARNVALYEDKIKNMGNAGRNGGEYYTPRPLIRAMFRWSRRRLASASTIPPQGQPDSSAKPLST
jgi:type I restriction enzyme M protein